MIEEKLLYEAVGGEIRKIRKAKGYNQSKLAEKVGVERTSITNIESGNQKATLFLLFKICELFNVRIEELLPSVDSIQTHKVDTALDSNYSVGNKTMEVLERVKNG